MNTELKELANQISELVSDIQDVKEKANSLKKDMADCDIPVNINVRRNEVEAFDDKLNRAKTELKDMK